jgi:hypothetical protein
MDRSSDAGRSVPSADAGVRLARAVSLLVRVEVERAVRAREPRLRALARDGFRLAMGGVAVLVAASLLSYAVVRALETTMSGWLAALLVATSLLVIGAILVVPVVKRARRLRQPLAGGEAASLEQAEAETAAAAVAIAEVIAGELARAEERTLVRSAEHDLGSAETEILRAGSEFEAAAERIEREAQPALGELADIIGQTGEAGLRVLRRLLP